MRIRHFERSEKSFATPRNLVAVDAFQPSAFSIHISAGTIVLTTDCGIIETKFEKHFTNIWR